MPGESKPRLSKCWAPGFLEGPSLDGLFLWQWEGKTMRYFLLSWILWGGPLCSQNPDKIEASEIHLKDIFLSVTAWNNILSIRDQCENYSDIFQLFGLKQIIYTLPSIYSSVSGDANISVHTRIQQSQTTPPLFVHVVMACPSIPVFEKLLCSIIDTKHPHECHLYY